MLTRTLAMMRCANGLMSRAISEAETEAPTMSTVFKYLISGQLKIRRLSPCRQTAPDADTPESGTCCNVPRPSPCSNR